MLYHSFYDHNYRLTWSNLFTCLSNALCKYISDHTIMLAKGHLAESNITLINCIPCWTNAPYTIHMALCRVEDVDAFACDDEVCALTAWIRFRTNISTPTTGITAAIQAHTAKSKGAKSEKMFILSSGFLIRIPTE